MEASQLLLVASTVSRRGRGHTHRGGIQRDQLSRAEGRREGYGRSRGAN